MRQALTPGIANEAFDILVRHCGAPESLRRGFLQCECDATTNGCSEYRFGGGLGSGGKFWNNDGRLYVTAYPEDCCPDRQRMIDGANAALARLRTYSLC